MPVTVGHVLTATTPDDPAYEIRPSHWNSAHAISLNLSGTDIIGAFSNDPAVNVSFSTNAGGFVIASANVTAAPSPVNVTGDNGNSVNAQTIAFKNANGLTLGVSTAANGASITGSYTVPSTAGLISAVNVSAGTTSGNLSALTFNNANGVSFGLNASTITASVVQSVQTQASGAIAGSGFTSAGNNIGLSGTHNSLGLSLSATVAAQTNQTAGIYVTAQSTGQSSSSTYDARSLSFVPDGIISAGWSNGSFRVSATQSAQTQSNVQGIIVSNTTYRTGDVSFSNANGISFGSSAGQAVTASYTVPSVTQYFSKTNTTFNGANISGSITNNTDGLQLSLSVAAGGGAGFSGGISGGNTSGDTGTVSNQLVFAGGNNITVSGSTNAGGMTVTISGANAGGAQTGISSLIAGQSQTVGALSFSNANGVSFGIASGANTGTLTASVAAQSNQTGGIYVTAQSTGQSSSSTYDLRTLSVVGDGIVSAGWSNGTFRISATQSNQAASANNGSFAFQTVSFSNVNNVSFATAAGSAIQGSFALNVSATGGTSNALSGLTFRDSNGVSFGLSTGAGVGSITASVAAQTNQTGGIYITAQSTGQSSSSTYDVRTLSMVGDGIVSIGWSNSTLRVSATQSNQAASASNGSFTFQTLNFSNANNVTFGTSAGGVVTASVAAGGGANLTAFATSNTTQSSTGVLSSNSMIFAGAGIASVGISNGSVVISVPSGGGAGDGGVFAGVSNLGNTAGSTGTVSTGNFVLVGSNGISLSQSTGAAGSAATVTILGAPAFTGSWWQPEVWGNTLSVTHGNGTVYLRPFELDGAFDADYILMQQSYLSSASGTTYSVSGSVSAGNASSGTGSWGQSGTMLMWSRLNTNETNASYGSIQTFDSKTYSMSAGYSLSVSWSTNVSSATVSFTTSGALGYLKNIDSAGGITTSSTGTSGSSSFSSTSTNANSFSSSFAASFVESHRSGMRPLFIPGSGTNMPAGEYWIGLIQSTNTGSTNYSLQRIAQCSAPQMLYFTGSTNNYMELGNSVAITTSNYRPGFGSYSASSQTTTAIPLSQISLMASNASMYFAIVGKTL